MCPNACRLLQKVPATIINSGQGLVWPLCTLSPRRPRTPPSRCYSCSPVVKVQDSPAIQTEDSEEPKVISGSVDLNPTSFPLPAPFQNQRGRKMAAGCWGQGRWASYPRTPVPLSVQAHDRYNQHLSNTHRGPKAKHASYA